MKHHKKRVNTVVIGVGSNIQPQKNIALAKQKLKSCHCIIGESRIHETEPIGYRYQPNFYNGVILIETEQSYEECKKSLMEIEVALGRKRGKNKYSPRTIDLDIVVWNGRVVDDDYYEREFLREAVLEVWPDLEV